MKLLIMQSSSHHCYLIPLQPRHLPQPLILKHPLPMYVCMYVCIYARSCTHTHTHNLLEGIKSEGRMALYHECHTRLCHGRCSQSHRRGIGCTLGQSMQNSLCYSCTRLDLPPSTLAFLYQSTNAPHSFYSSTTQYQQLRRLLNTTTPTTLSFLLTVYQQEQVVAYCKELNFQKKSILAQSP